LEGRGKIKTATNKEAFRLRCTSNLKFEKQSQLKKFLKNHVVIYIF